MWRTEETATRMMCPIMSHVLLIDHRPVMQNEFCQGSTCMMWRQKLITERQIIDGEDRKVHETMGYCGLAGEPSL